MTLLIKGYNAYEYLKAEKGVHRLVRISPFDSSGRRHTSFVSCDVVPEINDEVELDIRTEDLKIDTYRASGAGGQHINTTDSAVRITHLPTGGVVTCQNERSQIKNRERAMTMLRSKLYERKIEEQQRELAEIRANGVGTMMYGINKHNNNKGPFVNRKDYVFYDKIITFEVNAYGADTSIPETPPYDPEAH